MRVVPARRDAVTFTRPRYVIAVPDLARSVAFYGDVLGFTVHETGHPGLRIVERGACVILVGEDRNGIPPIEIGDHSYFAYVEAEPIDLFYADVTARGVEIVKTIRDEPWGMREFGIRTADGHRIMFAAPANAR